MCIFYTKNEKFFDLYYYGLLEVGTWRSFSRYWRRRRSVITYPHLRILPITSADDPRNISPQFTLLNIRTSAAPHIRILPEANKKGFNPTKDGAIYAIDARTATMLSVATSLST